MGSSPSSLVRRALLAAALLLFVICAPAGARAARPAGAAPYGLVAFNATFVHGSTVAQRTASYRRLYEAGVRAIRLDISWVQVQPPGSPARHYDFAERDREVRAITRAGLKVIGILGYGNPDYSTRGGVVQRSPLNGGIPPFYVANAQYFPPDDPADFARYARATARHYGQRAIAWEVWNEENEGWRFWPPREDPPAYARLLCATYGALKAVAPTTPVLYGGMFFPAVADQPGQSAPHFLEATYRADPRLGRCYDALAYHPYPYPFTAPELDVPIRGSVLSAAGQLRSVLARHRDAAKPLWITEVGWPTHDRTYGVSETKQAQYVARMQAATFAQRIPVLTWYTYGDYADPTGANQEAWFGFFRADDSAKPSYRALRTFSRVFARARFASDRSGALGLPPGRQDVGGRGFALEYRRPGTAITALWLASESVAEGQGQLPGGGTLSPATLRVRLPVRARSVTVVDYLGSRRRLRARRGAVSLDIAAGPIYVLDARPVRRGRRPGTGGRHRRHHRAGPRFTG